MPKKIISLLFVAIAVSSFFVLSDFLHPNIDKNLSESDSNSSQILTIKREPERAAKKNLERKIAQSLPLQGEVLQSLPSHGAEWQVVRHEDGRPAIFSSGELHFSDTDPLLITQNFLKEYGNLFGVKDEQVSVEKIFREGDISQVFLQQLYDGNPIFGTRLNLVMNNHGDIIYIVSDFYQSGIAPGNFLISPEQAAQISRNAIVKKWGPLVIDDPAFTVENLQSLEVKGYRFSNNKIVPVYQWNLTSSSTIPTDTLIEVDAVQGICSILKSTSRN